MSTDILDTLTAEHQARELLTHDIDDITTRLDDIHDWYPQLATTMTNTPAATLNLTGIRGTTDRIPGGDALTMRGPWSPGYDEPDNLPHPAQIISEWAGRWHQATRTPIPHHTKWAHHLATIRANTPWFIRMDTSGAFRTDIRALWHRLARLTGNDPNTATHDHRGPTEAATEAARVPDHTRVTLPEADLLFPGIRNRIDVDRHRERTAAKSQKRPATYRCQPDKKRRYLVGDLRKHYGATQFKGTLHSHAENM